MSAKYLGKDKRKKQRGGKRRCSSSLIPEKTKYFKGWSTTKVLINESTTYGWNRQDIKSKAQITNAYADYGWKLFSLLL